MTDNSSEAEQILSALAHGNAPDGVAVLPRVGNEIAHPNCLVVEPFRNAEHGERLFATVEHFVKIDNPTGFPWDIKPIPADALDFTDAIKHALAYAQRERVPVILVNHDSLSSPSERQQTDTTVLNLRMPKSGR